MKQTTTTHIAKLRGQYVYNRKQVLWLTGMADEELSALQFSTGLDWLQHYTHADRLLLVELMKESLIWSWWVNEWNRLDDQYTLRKLYEAKPEERLAAYRNIHNAVFVENIPTYALLEESYAKAIGQLNDKLKQS